MTIERPLFTEGQVLGADDLNGAVDYARYRQARHDRYQQSWGIITGLDLVGDDRETASGEKYKQVTLKAGAAVDGTGREIVVPRDTRLTPDLKDQLNIASVDPDEWFPVFLFGRDSEKAGEGNGLLGACETDRTSRVDESYEITFGRIGDLLEQDKQLTVSVADGPAGAIGGKVWRILLGFVRWDGTIDQFNEIAHEAGGFHRRFAGARADEVVARGGALALRTAEQSESDKPTLVVDAANGGELRFGLQDSKGAVDDPAFRVDTEGNVFAKGKIVGALAGTAQVESGVASDGVLLPLPPGITQKKVDDGKVVIHVHVTPRFHGQAPDSAPLGEAWRMFPIECRVEQRRLFCRVRWELSDGSADPIEEPGVCDYTLVALGADDGDQ